MNAEAHLRAQGWQGPGTGLRAGSLQRAILTSKKTDLKGLGAKTRESDQWWDNIFSKQLSNITVGASGEIGQINGGIKAAHPVAARNAHRRQFGEKSALEKVFMMGEVLKGSECFIPLAPSMANSPVTKDKTSSKKRKEKPEGSDERKKEKKSRRREQSESAKHVVKARKVSSKASKSTADLPIATLPSPPPSPKTVPTSDSTTMAQSSTEDNLRALSDRQIRKEARRLRKETKVMEKAGRAARREHRRLKKAQKGQVVS